MVFSGGDVKSILNITNVDQRMVSLAVPIHGNLYRLAIEIESTAGTSLRIPLETWACGAPMTPKEPKVTYGTDPTVFNVSWDVDPLTELGGCALRGFRVEMDTALANNVQLCDPASRMTDPFLRSCLAENAERGKRYPVRVVVYNLRTFANGFPLSVLAGAVPLKMNVSLTQTAGEDGALLLSTVRQIIVTWDIPIGVFNGETPVGFALYHDDGNGSPISQHPDPQCRAPIDPACTSGCEKASILTLPTATTCTVFGVEEGTSYRFQVAAINVFGEGEKSDISSFESGSVPDARAMRAFAVTSNAQTPSITFGWKHFPDRGNFVFNYKAEIRRRLTASQTANDPIGSWTGAGTLYAPLRILELEFDATNTAYTPLANTTRKRRFLAVVFIWPYP